MKFIRLLCPDHPDRDVEVRDNGLMEAYCGKCGIRMVTVEEFNRLRAREIKG